MKIQLAIILMGAAALSGCSSTTTLTKAEPNEVPKWFVDQAPQGEEQSCANGSYTTDTVEDAVTGAIARADGAISTDIAGNTSRSVDQRSISRSKRGPGITSQQIKVRTLIESERVPLRPWTEEFTLHENRGMVTAYVQRCQDPNTLPVQNEFDFDDENLMENM